MKKWHKITIIVVVIFIVLVLGLLTTKIGRSAISSLLNPILKPFSEACGYGGTSRYKVDCDCNGILTRDVKTGATTYNCVGKCSQCKCYKQDLSTYEKTGGPTLTEVNCSTFSQLNWAFPLK